MTTATPTAVNRHVFSQATGLLGVVLLTLLAAGCAVVPLDHPLLRSARQVGTCFGD